MATLVKERPSNSLGVAAENGGLQRKVNDMEGKSLEAASSVKQLRAKISAMAEERDSLAANCGELALKLQCGPVLSEEAKSLSARVAEMVEASKMKTSIVQKERRTADTKVVAGLARTESAEHTAQIA